MFNRVHTSTQSGAPIFQPAMLDDPGVYLLFHGRHKMPDITGKHHDDNRAPVTTVQNPKSQIIDLVATGHRSRHIQDTNLEGFGIPANFQMN